MAQYKVLQDIEAEDKLLGPLSLRQFIYAAITIALGFVTFRLFITSIWFIGFVFVPPALFFGLLAAPLGGQQSSEIWLLAKIRFFIKPRKRLWDQTGIQQLVTITVPKKIEKQLTKGYSQDEVKSRLRTLATTLDTRGWAVKNVTSNVYAVGGASGSERLLDIASATVPAITSEPTVDMFDTSSNPRAQNFDQLIQQASEEHKDAVQKNIQRAKQEKAIAEQEQQRRQQIAHEATLDEAAVLETIKQNQAVHELSQANMHRLEPITNNPPKQSEQPVTPPPDPAIMEFVKDKEGLSVQTTAGLYNRMKEQSSDDEVVISLH
jgi:hypothetical protein